MSTPSLNTDIKTDNELIARFHGWTHVPTPKGKGDGHWNFPVWDRGYFNSEQFRYHNSWDWLHPVLEKIADMENEVLEFMEDDSNELADYSVFTKIKYAYPQVVKFIKWYNNQQSNHEQPERKY